MNTFTLIRTYSCRKATGFVYDINGKRAASLARSLDVLKTSLGIVEVAAPKHGDKIAAEMMVADMASKAGIDHAEMVAWIAQLASGRMRKADAARVVALREVAHYAVVANRPNAPVRAYAVQLHAVMASGDVVHIGPLDRVEDGGFAWLAAA
jgi:hypothetical protein